jgi:ferredoxin, 2Fe-2S
MPKLIITTRQGIEHQLDGKPGISLMANIRDGGIDELTAICNGCCSCATCHVYIDEAFLDRLSEMSPDETDLLDSSTHRRKSSRLSCQVILSESLGGMRVTVSPED